MTADTLLSLSLACGSGIVLALVKLGAFTKAAPTCASCTHWKFARNNHFEMGRCDNPDPMAFGQGHVPVVTYPAYGCVGHSDLRRIR